MSKSADKNNNIKDAITKMADFFRDDPENEESELSEYIPPESEKEGREFLDEPESEDAKYLEEAWNRISEGEGDEDADEEPSTFEEFEPETEDFPLSEEAEGDIADEDLSWYKKQRDAGKLKSEYVVEDETFEEPEPPEEEEISEKFAANKLVSKMATKYAKNLSKTAEYFDPDEDIDLLPEFAGPRRDVEEAISREDEEDEMQAPWETLTSGEEEDEDVEPVFSDLDVDTKDIKRRLQRKEPPTFEDFAPELRHERKDIERQLEDMEFKQRMEEKEKMKSKAYTANDKILKIAKMYIQAGKGTEGAYFEGLEDLPEETEGKSLKETLEHEQEPTVLEKEETTEESEDEPGDPGEYMPLTDEQAELAKEDKANRLALIKERHKAYLESQKQEPEEDIESELEGSEEDWDTDEDDDEGEDEE